MNRLCLASFLAVGSLVSCGSGSSGPASSAPAAAAATPADTATSAAAPATLAALGQRAPAFTLTGLDGTAVSLADYAGKVVVLEWFNPGCPFVEYAHGEGPLKDQAKRRAADGVVWLAINSGAPGKQGAGVDTNQSAVADWGMAYPVLLDESGAVGRQYEAKTTPHMYVIDARGTLVYRGALDNAPLGEVDGAVVNYVDAALDALLAGKPVATAETKSYGCSVKYGS
jgi:peroxiredoxin